MRKIKTFLYKHFSTFNSRLTFFFILAAFLPLMISIITALRIINTHLEERTETQLSYIASATVQQLENRLEEISRLQETLSSICIDYLVPVDDSEKITSQSLEKYQSLRSLISNLENIYNVKRIRIYSDNIPFTKNSYVNFFPLEILEEDFHQKTSSSSNFNRLDAIYPSSTSESEKMSFYRTLLNREGEIVAIFFIDLDNPLDNIILSSIQNADISILSPESQIIYSSAKDIQNPKPDQHLPLDKICFNNSKYSIIKSSSYSDWFYLFEVSSSEIDTVNRKLLHGYLLTFSSAIILCMIAIAYLPHIFSKKIKYLSDKINNLSDEVFLTGNLTAEILPDSQFMPIIEIDTIVTAFSNLFHRNIYLQTSLQEQKLEYYKTKLSLLQAQINPHFLYNSLDTISICLLLNQNDTARKLINSLAHFYRFSLSKGKDILTIAEELEMIQAYLEIERIGYKEHINWEIVCNEQNSTYSIPKFTLQPIVENSIIHGFSNILNKPLFIQIHVQLTDVLYITITDNGSGIDSKRLEEINTLLSSPNPTPTSNYGLLNCCQRIRLYNGNSYGIQLSNTNPGTQTIITLPAVTPQ